MFRKIYFILLFLFSIICVFLGFNSTIIPNLLLYLIIGFYLVFLFIIFLLFKKKKISIIIGFIISIILMICNIFILFIYIKANSFLDKITNVEYEISSYSVIVLKESSYEKLEDLSEIATFSNSIDTNYDKALEELNEMVEIDIKEYDNIFYLVNDLLNEKIEAIFINENYIDMIDEVNSGFSDKIRIIETIDISTLAEDLNKDVSINELENINVYISGIDTYGDISKVSRSDVNILATVNLKNNKILLTNIPRDYYVQLTGTSGLKDKLTHAGVYGINTSIGTLEDLLDTEINYYVRVNFNSLVTLVDYIGGIEIYSDMTFNSYHISGWVVQEGINYMDGKKALAYSRERYAYLDGDRHRGQNQQQVIEAIINKITEKNDLKTYLNLLSTVENSFQTNIDKNLINQFINLQVKNNFKWSVESISVTGYDSMNYTYSYPNQLLYVMTPDENSLNTAINMIKEFLEEE